LLNLNFAQELQIDDGDRSGDTLHAIIFFIQNGKILHTSQKMNGIVKSILELVRCFGPPSEDDVDFLLQVANFVGKVDAAVFAPVLQQSSLLVKELLSATKLIHSIFCNLLRDGFCRPLGEDDGEEGEEMVQGTGMGSVGDGDISQAKDVTDEIEDEEQLEGLEGDDDKTEQPQNNTDSGMETKQELGGTAEEIPQDADENELESNEDAAEEDTSDMEKTLGDGGEQEEAVDARLWNNDDESDEEGKFDGLDKMEQDGGNDEVAAAEEADEIESKRREKEEAGKAGEEGESENSEGESENQDGSRGDDETDAVEHMPHIDDRRLNDGGPEEEEGAAENMEQDAIPDDGPEQDSGGQNENEPVSPNSEEALDDQMNLQGDQESKSESDGDENAGENDPTSNRDFMDGFKEDSPEEHPSEEHDSPGNEEHGGENSNEDVKNPVDSAPHRRPSEGTATTNQQQNAMQDIDAVAGDTNMTSTENQTASCPEVEGVTGGRDGSSQKENGQNQAAIGKSEADEAPEDQAEGEDAAASKDRRLNLNTDVRYWEKKLLSLQEDAHAETQEATENLDGNDDQMAFDQNDKDQGQFGKFGVCTEEEQKHTQAAKDELPGDDGNRDEAVMENMASDFEKHLPGDAGPAEDQPDETTENAKEDDKRIDEGVQDSTAGGGLVGQQLEEEESAAAREMEEAAIMTLNEAFRDEAIMSLEKGKELWRALEITNSEKSTVLCERLRLVLEPTVKSKLSGHFKSGKKLSMRKVIDFIASDYRRDAIWLRRVEPEKRAYNILLAIDDSESMLSTSAHSVALQALHLTLSALAKLEAGRVGVVRFGESPEMLWSFGDARVGEDQGGQLVSRFTFAQRSTDIAKLMTFSLDALREERRSGNGDDDLVQLMFIISDGRVSDRDRLRQLVRDAASANVVSLFVLLDQGAQSGETSTAGGANPAGSIMDVKKVEYVEEKGKRRMKLTGFMEAFPFPFYVMVRDIAKLPEVVGDALRQWLEVIGQDLG